MVCLFGWLIFTAGQILGLFLSKMFLFYSFLVDYDCHLCCNLYIISGQTSVGNWLVVIIIIMVIMSCFRHGFSWFSLTIRLYLPSLPVDLYDYFLFCVHTDMLQLSTCCSANICMSMCRGPWENVAYEFVLISQAVSCMFCSSNLDVFWDGR